jgi:hypothetical protein
MKKPQEDKRYWNKNGHCAVQARIERTKNVATVELGGGEEIQGGSEETDPGGAADGMNQEGARRNAGMEEDSKETEKHGHAEDEVCVAWVCKAWNDLCVENAVGECRNGENEACEWTGSANIEEGAGGANRRTNEDEGAEGADEGGKRNEERIGGANVMIAAGEEMAELVSEKDGQQSECEGQAGDEAGGMLVEEFEGTNVFVERGGLIVGIGDGELRAGSKAGAESEEEKDAGDDKHLARRAGKGGVIEIGGRNGAPIDVEGNVVARVFWVRWIHERLRRTEMDALKREERRD